VLKASEDDKGAEHKSHQNPHSGVWGTDFNKSNQQVLVNDTSKKSPGDETKTEASNMMHKLSSKLFEMAKKSNTTKKTPPKFKSNECRSIDDSIKDSVEVNGKVFSNVKVKIKASVNKTSLNDGDVDITEKFNVKSKQRFSISFNASRGNDEKVEKISDDCEKTMDEVDGLSCSVFDSVNKKDLITESKEIDCRGKYVTNQRPRGRSMEKGGEHPKNLLSDESGQSNDVRWDNETTGIKKRNSVSDTSYSKKETVRGCDRKKENVEDDHGHKAGEGGVKVCDVSDKGEVTVMPKHSRKRRKLDAGHLNQKAKKRKDGSVETPDVSLFH
jgi:hypothetical protein